MLIDKGYKKTIQPEGKKVAIIGKNTNIEKYMPLDLGRFDVVVCLNGIVNYVDRCDWLVCLDTAVIDEFDDKGRANMTKVFIPEYPHLPNCTHEEFMAKLGVQCDYMIFDSHFSPKPNKRILRIDHVISVADTALQFMLWLGYRNFEFYGIGMEPRYYSKCYDAIQRHNMLEIPEDNLAMIDEKLRYWIKRYNASAIWNT
jgi:hypothetical protein